MLKVAVPEKQKVHHEIVPTVMSGVRAFFAVHKHRPSEVVYDALADIPRTVEKILSSRANRAMYVSSLDVGMGKTTTLKYTVKFLLGPPYDVGMVLCLGRLEQIESAIAELELLDWHYAVLAGKDGRTKGVRDHATRRELVPKGKLYSELGLGQANIDKAPVLFTTHAQLELRLQNGATWERPMDAEWKGGNLFSFKGEARAIRIWDETCSFRRHFSVSDRELHKIMGSDAPPEVRQYAGRLLEALRVAVANTDLDLPDAGDLPERIEDALERLTDADYKALAEPIRNLFCLGGKKKAAVRRASEGDTVAIQFDQRLPHDLLSLIVLDASAKDREAYQQAIEPIEDLRYAAKRYDNVTVNVKNGNSGRTAFWNKYAMRLAEAGEIIKAHPGRKVLVIHPKETKRWQEGKVQQGIDAALGSNHGRHIKYLHWGIHDAVNDFAECDLVICLTLYHLPQYAYEIMGRAAANERIGRAYEQDRINAVESGELRSTLRQGLGRSCIRILEGDQAKECIIYVQVPTKSSVKDYFKPMFPGCKVANAEGKLDRREQVMDFIAKHGGVRIYHDEIYNALGMRQGDFSRLVNSEPMKAELERIGRKSVRGRPSYLVRA